MTRSFLYLLFFLGYLPSALTQADTLFVFQREWVGDIQRFTADHLGNLYCIDRKDQVKKISPAGDSLAVYNDVRRLGRLSGIDVSNPLQPLLYYSDGVRFVVLDRFLNPISRIDLQPSNILQLQAWSRSYDNQLWVYDPLAYSLRKVDLNGRVLWSTPDFRLILKREFKPEQLFDHDRNLYLYEPEQGVFVFDYFGNLRNGIQLIGWSDLQVDRGYIYGRKGDTFYRYEIKSSVYDEWILPVGLRGAAQYQVHERRLYALFRQGEVQRIRIYRLP